MLRAICGPIVGQTSLPILAPPGANLLANLFWEIVEVTPRAQVEYEPDHPMFAGGDLGTCNPGA